MEIIYLIGQISPKKEETYLWRQQFRKDFSELEKQGIVEIIDPCQTEWNKDNNRNIIWDFEKGTNLFVPKDRNCVERSTIGVYNSIHYDQDKPFIGTHFELAWYYDSPKKAVIGIKDKTKTPYTEHPFILQAVNVWVDSLEECIQTIKHFMLKGLNNAK